MCFLQIARSHVLLSATGFRNEGRRKKRRDHRIGKGHCPLHRATVAHWCLVRGALCRRQAKRTKLPSPWTQRLSETRAQRQRGEQNSRVEATVAVAVRWALRCRCLGSACSVREVCSAGRDASRQHGFTATPPSTRSGQSVLSETGRTQTETCGKQ